MPATAPSVHVTMNKPTRSFRFFFPLVQPIRFYTNLATLPDFIGLEPIGPTLWQVYFGPTTLGWFDEELFVITDINGNVGRNPIC